MQSDQLLHFDEFHQSENQNDIPIFSYDRQKISIDHSVSQSTTNRPVLTTSEVLTGAVKITPGFDQPTAISENKIYQVITQITDMQGNNGDMIF